MYRFALFVCALVPWCSAASVGTFLGSGEKVDEAMGLLKDCPALNDVLLSDLLGAAFNPRYMSVDFPQLNRNGKKINPKRAINSFDFAVDDNYISDFEDVPAWDFVHTKSAPAERKISKRESGDDEKPWACQSIVKWMDLGDDYYPRYLRTVECTKSDCWYGQFTCKPRSFTVKILKRKRGECAKYKGARKTGNSGLPEELREMWIWEERAVNFCCDCSTR